MPVVLRDALHGLRAGRVTTVLAFAIFTLAVAAGTVTFSVVDTIALRPMPFESPGRLVAVGLLNSNGAVGEAATQDYFAWSNRVGAFSAMGAYRLNTAMTLDGAADGRPLSVARVTSGLFDALRVRPALGRLFRSEHDEPGGDNVVVLSHSLWATMFRSDPGVIGRPIVLGAIPRTVIGVLEPHVSYPVGHERASDAYIPMTTAPEERLDATTSRRFDVQVVGRLRDGVTIADAQRDIDALNAGRIGAKGTGPRTHLVVPLIDHVVGPARAWLVLALAGVACVVLIASVNVASLLLARATIRSRELATREVLGASRRRIIATLALEGLALSVAAGAMGIGLSVFGIRAIATLLPEGLARASAIALDARVLLTAILTILLCGIVFSSAPVWLVSRADLFNATKAGTGTVIGGRRQTRSLGAFLVVETAFVSALLVGTMLVVSTFILVTTADLGYDRRRLVVFEVQKDFIGVPASDRATVAATLRAELLRRVREVPGIAGAALIRSGVPMSGRSVSRPFGLAGRQGAVSVKVREVTPEYFPTMRLHVVAGRTLQVTDGAGAPRVIVINEVAAERFFLDEDPIGQAVTLAGPATIVGIVRGVRMFGPEEPLEPEAYLSINQVPTDQEDAFQVVVRSTGSSAAVARAARDAARAAIGAGEVLPPRLFDDLFWRMTAERRFNAGVMTAFGLIALAIGALGVYGTMAFVVAQDVRAIGLRLALGATPGRIRASVVREALGRVSAGLIIGLIGAWMSSNLLSSLVFGVEPTSLAVYATVGVLMAVVGVVAAIVPAVRASRLDPLAALRAD